MTYMNATNITGIVDLMSYANTVSGGLFSVGILISLFAIISISSIIGGMKKEGLVTAGFITLLAAILMRIINLIPDYVLIFTIVVFFGLMFMFFTSERS